ncbi:MAG TPA: hypothetical protein VIP11_26915 [Gemmatimonadaceae bacterium]
MRHQTALPARGILDRPLGTLDRNFPFDELNRMNDCLDRVPLSFFRGAACMFGTIRATRLWIGDLSSASADVVQQ